MSSAPDLNAIKAALAEVVDPTFDKTLGQLGTLLTVAAGDGGVRLAVRCSSPAKELQTQIEASVKDKLAALGQSLEAIDWVVQVPTREVLSTDPVPGVRNVVLVMSGKGGVGKSTVATNIALALKRAGTRVGLLDADMYGPSLPTMFGINGRPAVQEDKKIIPLERFGIKLMSLGFLLEDEKAAVVWRGPMLHGALNQFLQDVNWGQLDYLILDCPPGTGDVALTLAQKLKVTGCLMVTTPQEVALQDVYKGISMCEKLHIPVLGVVENMSYFVDPAGNRHELFGAGGGEKVATFAKAPLLGQVPLETAVRHWGDEGMPVVQAKPDSAAAQVFAAIAEKLSEEIAQRHFERGGGEKAPAAEGPKRLRILR